MSEFFSKNVIINKSDTILMQGNGIFLLVSKGSKYLLTPTSCDRGIIIMSRNIKGLYTELAF